MKKILPVILVLFFTFSAYSFNSSLETIQKSANASSPAEFNLKIENPSSKNNTYSVSLLSPKSSWFYYSSTIRVPANSNKSSKITVSPVENALQQKYRFDGKIRETQTGEIQDFTGFFNVEQPYKLHILGTTQNKNSVKPGETVNTEIEIQNLDNRPVDNYQITAQYKNQTQTDTGTPILSEAKRKYQFQFQTSKKASPGTHPINYTVTADGKKQATTQDTLQTQSTQNITETSQTENKVFTVSKKLQTTNTGNSPTNTSLTAEIPSYLQSITTTDPTPDTIEEINGKTVYTWTKTLQSEQSFDAGYTTNYWIPFTGITLLSLGIIAIKLLSQNINLRKTTETEGNAIKIKIEIENISERTFDRLELQEFIPDIATVDESFDMNTPKIRKTSQGTKLTWNVENLEPGDQRIIQYKIKPKVQVEEQVELQKAEIKNMEGKTIAESNTTTSEFNT